MNQLSFIFLFCFLLVGRVARVEDGHHHQADPWQVKAVLLFKIFDFIDWPLIHRSQDDIFLIGIYQDTKVLHVLRDAYFHRLAKSKSIEVVLVKNEREMVDTSFDVIWVGKVSETHLQDLLPYLQQTNALIVSDTPGYAQKVSMINFFESEGKIKFEINRRILTQKGFVVNFRLLKLAKVVE